VTLPGRAPPPLARPSPARGCLAWGLGVLVALVAAAPVAAQDSHPLYLTANPENGSLEMRLGNLLQDEGLVAALHSGLPLRLQVKAELWKDGFFDSQRGRGEWRSSVLYDPLERRYRVAFGGQGAAEVAADSLPEVAHVLQVAFTIPLRPFEPGRYYYLGQVMVETLSLSDLDELQRWLQGDLATPAEREEERVGTALGRGVHRVMVRMLGIPTRRWRVRTERFTFEPRDPS